MHRSIIGISMGKSVTLLLVIIFAIASCIAVKPALSVADVVEDSWVLMAPMNVARAYLGVAVVNGKIYAIGGDEGSVQYSGSGHGRTIDVVNFTEEYDPATDTWAIKAAMPTARALFATAEYEKKVYCIGGYNGSYDGQYNWFDQRVNEVYDPATDTWEIKAALPTPRFGPVAEVVDGKIYVIGGGALSSFEPTSFANEVYDPETDSWEAMSPSPQEISLGSPSAVVDNKIFVFEYTSVDIQVYDPANDSWSVTPLSTRGSPARYGVSSAAAATAGLNAPERVYFFDEHRTDVFDPANNTWVNGTVMPTGRFLAGAAVVDCQRF